MRFKNWKEFQHYKNRRPPWIKLHASLLDDSQYHALNSDSAKYLILAWIIASKDKDGNLPKINDLAFQLRVSLEDCKRFAIEWGHWLEHDDSDLIADCKHDDSKLLPQNRIEKRQREKRKEKNISAPSALFEEFWKEYPRHIAKAEALKAWVSLGLDEKAGAVAGALESFNNRIEQDGTEERFIPHPATWLRREDFDAVEEPARVERRDEPIPLPKFDGLTVEEMQERDKFLRELAEKAKNLGRA